ncbi:MAG: polyribonucleotide nucleotidyltransferase [Candidatus Terrybacteria bacterium RIFCSPLOWO2_01_FULL_44_24]|uniref:Polyribonucleotide nucleotidyltransferase n=1 Tax=Candidatus Terrybacteria bacterium RIFCSPHIGHO2_01_FULL_43_35 TaxID=1802361 RepID=A0A1G2PGE7_9BACT|nr:MAG: polyribonucleotide nucleotidyltransferase [Candidatus Terrybacteria bacterium RIFCSPHIGHO2_01_FULL_43_35]OHA50928.1 MAG: polyribonucleotide nucleotidyltransferase [Candidatus Terrybacteria bacterium RIFCSPLOWO2_01_FULL_44_24]
MKEIKTFRANIGGKEIKVSLPHLAEQASGEALIQCGDTIVLVTAVMGKTPREGIDFFPLMVEFEEKYYAAGEIKSSRFMKREGRPSDEAVLSARLVDRTIRPLFPAFMRNEVQVVATTLSYDYENDPDVLGIIGASLALSTSDIPWGGPIAGIRIGRDSESNWIMFPTTAERSSSSLDLVVAGTRERINMLEGGLYELSEKEAVEAITVAQKAMQELFTLQEEIVKTVKPNKASVILAEPDEKTKDFVLSFLGKKLGEVMFDTSIDKLERARKMDELKKALLQKVSEENIDIRSALAVLEEETDKIVHEKIINGNQRPDGRALDELRELSSSVGILPRIHGSALFTRGNTKSLAALTLGAPSDELLIETMEGERKKRFMLHYNFPPFSVGETGFFRGPGRREIGHGMLAEKALAPLIPDKDDFPYTIRIVSEILSSNGSSSMASVCAGCLALMDGGVPIKKMAAGIAMGLMTDSQGHWKVLTDIQGPEDHYGDMDFKVAGTRDGITAVQMDVKIEGATLEMLEAAFAQAKEARLKILDVMSQALPEPRPSLSAYAPRILTLMINPDKIRDVIGPGGKMINTITEQTGTQIDIEQTGKIYITGKDPVSAEKALNWINDLTREIMPGEKFDGTVTRMFPFGIMVEIAPGQEGLVHNSKIAAWGVRSAEELVKTGDKMPVEVEEIDSQGRVNLKPQDSFMPERKLSGAFTQEADRFRPRNPQGQNRGRDDRRGRGPHRFQRH